MIYKNVTEAIFIDRPNRFIAHVNVNGSVETVHPPLIIFKGSLIIHRFSGSFLQYASSNQNGETYFSFFSVRNDILRKNALRTRRILERGGPGVLCLSKRETRHIRPNRWAKKYMILWKNAMKQPGTPMCVEWQ